MAQILKSKDYGEISFEKTYIQGQLHIGKLTGGGYAHVSGHPLRDMEEGLEAIPPGPDRQEFLKWWDEKDNPPEEAVKRKIMISPEGDYVFDDGADGAPIEKAEDLIQYFGTGEALEQALRWFGTELLKREKAEKAASEALSSKAGKMGAEQAKRGFRNKASGTEQENDDELAVKD